MPEKKAEACGACILTLSFKYLLYVCMHVACMYVYFAYT